jgi:hypothetical protein
MSRLHSLSLSALVLAVAVPFAWLACGGGKPPETPADESSNSDGGDTTATTDKDKGASSASPASSSASDDSSSSAAPAASATAAAPPAPPALGDSDCGKCIDKTCAKAVTACGKNPDCQSTLDGIHGCTTAAGGCIANASMPPKGKGKKLAAGYGACAKKATTKACKAQCQ